LFRNSQLSSASFLCYGMANYLYCTRKVMIFIIDVYIYIWYINIQYIHIYIYIYKCDYWQHGNFPKL
jgi:hypothetical protein